MMDEHDKRAAELGNDYGDGPSGASWNRAIAAELRRASAEGEARGLGVAADYVLECAADAEDVVSLEALAGAIRELAPTPAEPARSYEDGVRDGLELGEIGQRGYLAGVAAGLDAAADDCDTQGSRCEAAHQGEPYLAMAKRIRALKAVPRG